MLRPFLIITMVVLIGAGASPASAQGPDICQDSACGGWLFFGAIAGTAALTVDTILVVEAIEKASRGHGLYQTGATFEIFWGLSHMATGAAIAAHATDEELGLVALGIPIALVGAYFVVHGAFSLGSGRPPPPPEEEPEAEEGASETDETDSTDDAVDETDDEPAAEPIEPAAALSIAPTLGGAMIRVFGTF